ncbi:sensor histidine kinase [Saccharibacillus kuerlensis]|uniref:histidine kinase n=1 Tax=Saccharibacillus kuerlensis TaxID=459527 RepID=A0ABQ2L014_9BACL|nr:HAMP domain-containing sensor histidine kinase [Saccharibacillus kuerlensis]GGN98086.1 hypothetical protein GCM10010969_16710 [Saccharibacillus kuerlensis]
MKLRTWLLIAFLALMLLPLAAGIVFYQLIGKLDAERSFTDYMAVSNRIAQVESIVRQPKLYRSFREADYKELDEQVDDSLRIELFTPKGTVLYSSMEGSEHYAVPLMNRNLYAELYELQINPRSYVKKEPVFENGEMVGLYEITAARGEWQENIRQRTMMVGSVLGLFILLLYMVMLLLIRRKLIRPMQLLIDRMNAFASGEPITTADYRSSDEMGRLMKHFTDMQQTIEASRQELERKQQEKAFMISALSHDLKTPLTSIRAYAEGLDSQLLDEREEGEYRRQLIAQADRMHGMLDDLSLYAVLEKGGDEEQKVEVEAEEFLEMLLEGYGALAMSRDVRLETEISVSGGRLSVDPQLMMRMMDNLVGNAVRHTPVGGRLILGAMSASRQLPAWLFPPFADGVRQLCGAESEDVLLLVQNEGEPVPEELLNRLFEPFYQGNASRSLAGAGSFGLGLTIASRIVRRHGGEIKLFSEENYGTLVVCRLQGIETKQQTIEEWYEESL